MSLFQRSMTPSYKTQRWAALSGFVIVVLFNHVRPHLFLHIFPHLLSLPQSHFWRVASLELSVLVMVFQGYCVSFEKKLLVWKETLYIILVWTWLVNCDDGKCFFAFVFFFPLLCSSCDSLGRLARAVSQWRAEQTNSSQIKLRPRRLRTGPPTSTRYESLPNKEGTVATGNTLRKIFASLLHSIGYVLWLITPVSDAE